MLERLLGVCTELRAGGGTDEGGCTELRAGGGTDEGGILVGRAI